MTDDIADVAAPKTDQEAGTPDGSISRRSVFLTGTALAAASLTPASLVSATSAQAQAARPPVNAAPPQVSVLPYPDPEFKGVHRANDRGLQAGLSAADFGAEGAPNVLLILTDDVGFGASSAFGGPIPTPTLEALAANGLKYNAFNTTALVFADPRRPHHRARPAQGPHRHHHGAQPRLSGI